MINASQNNVQVEIPDPSVVEGREYVIKLIDNGGGGNAAEIVPDQVAIDKSSSLPLITEMSSVKLQSDGSDWWVTSRYQT